MSKDNSGDKKNMDLNDVEMVFGTPEAPKRDIKPEVHIANEKKNGKDEPRKEDKTSNDNEHDSDQPMQPLLEPDRTRQKPPLAGPEIDDLDTDAPAPPAGYPGIDDGLLEDKKPEVPNGEESPEDTEKEKDGSDHETHEDGVNTEDGNLWLPRSRHGVDETDFYYGDGYIGNGIQNRFGEDRPGSPMMPGSIPDVNTYQQKKNLAQGMMDLALLSANANQLRYVLESSITHPYYYPSLVFISCSIILQIAVGVGLIMNSRYNVKDEKDICKADKINNMTVLGIFLITIVNVFITSFSVATPTATNALVAGQLNG